MNKNIAKLLKAGNRTLLRQWYEGCVGTSRLEESDWKLKQKSFLEAHSKHFESLDEPQKAELLQYADKIIGMNDMVGHNAANDLTFDEGGRERFKAYENDLDRLIWLKLEYKDLFQLIHDQTAFDRSRNKPCWQCYSTQPNLKIARDGERLAEFEAEIIKLFDQGKTARVQIYDRRMSQENEKRREVVQVVIQRELLGKSVDAVVNDEIDILTYRPVEEMGIIYRPQVGELEVVCSRKAQRVALAKLFLKLLGSCDDDATAVNLKSYNFDQLRKCDRLPVDHDSEIAGAWLHSIEFECPNTHDRARFIKKRGESGIRENNIKRHGNSSCFVGADRVMSAEIKVKFRKTTKRIRARTLSIKFGQKTTCNLRELSEEEQIIGEIYLQKWGLLVDEAE